MTFNEWLEEHEGLSGPSMYRLMDEINSPNPAYNDMILKWLEAAWQVGYDDAVLRMTDDGK